ncbi:MAG: hypothetical protein A4E29_00299 [Methanomassiliicoccales archaeon PtaB.Bin134]|nr:MAG: hypothetical protein A4E29_00299 [Methanomassiliicoccales archaeon PtaB.Bin134]
MRLSCSSIAMDLTMMRLVRGEITSMRLPLAGSSVPGQGTVEISSVSQRLSIFLYSPRAEGQSRILLNSSTFQSRRPISCTILSRMSSRSSLTRTPRSYSSATPTPSPTRESLFTFTPMEWCSVSTRGARPTSAPFSSTIMMRGKDPLSKCRSHSMAQSKEQKMDPPHLFRSASHSAW